MKSILQKEKECLICKTTQGLHLHHCFEGSRRRISDRYGLTVYLCGKHHNLSNQSVHMNESLNNDLKRWAQKKTIQYYGWSIEDFISRFGINYIRE